MANINDFQENFNEKEKRLASFKGLFNILNTTSIEKLPKDELFYKGSNVFPDEIITEAATIITDPLVDFITILNRDQAIKPAIKRIWVTGSGVNLQERYARGHLSSSIEDTTGANPYVEKIICPLTKVVGTNDQFYVSYAPPEGSVTSEGYNEFYEEASDSNYQTREFDQSALFSSQSFILKNFINPTKFGKEYTARIFTSPHDSTETNGGLISDINANNFENFTEDNADLNYNAVLPTANTRTEGWLFDYKEGTVFFGLKGPLGGGTDGDDPDLTLKNHPLWLVAYRYNGPTGISGNNVNITASNIQVNDNLNVDGTLSFQGFNFIEQDLATFSGSTRFGSGSISALSHSFTGSVQITGSLSVNGVDISSGGSGGTGTILVSSSNYNKLYGNYFKTTHTPTDTNDVTEFIGLGNGFIISSSIGSPNGFQILLGSSSNLLINKPNRGPNGYGTPENNNLDGYYRVPTGGTIVSSPVNFVTSSNAKKSYDLFKFTTSSGKDLPDLSSYAAFVGKTEGGSDRFSKHIFSFDTPTIVSKIGLYYSRGGNESLDFQWSPSHSVEEIQFSGSNDNGNTWTPLFVTTSMNQGITSSNGGVPHIPHSIISSSDPRMPNVGYDSATPDLPDSFNISIAHFTSSVFDNPFPYTHYKLAVSGGAFQLSSSGESFRMHYIHHIDLYQQKTFGTGNRKQLNIGFDDTPNINQPSLTNFEVAVSGAANKVGLTHLIPDDEAFFFTGTAGSDVDLNNFNINNVNRIQADLLSGSTVKTNHLNVFKVSNLNDTNIDTRLSVKKSIFLGNDDVFDLPSSSIVLESLNPIFFTNKKQDGLTGVDQFSARIFGHYTQEGVSDLYLDAFRIFNVADKEFRFITLDPQGSTTISSSLINLSSSKTHISGTVRMAGDVTMSKNLRVNGTIDASNFTQNGEALEVGGGSGFPHNQGATSGIIANITGSLIISGNDSSTIPYIQLHEIPVGSTTLDEFDPPALYVKNNQLFYGTNLIADSTAGTTTILNGVLSSDFDLGGFNITGEGNINITGSITASTITASEIYSNNIETVNLTASNGILTNTINTNQVTTEILTVGNTTISGSLIVNTISASGEPTSYNSANGLFPHQSMSFQHDSWFEWNGPLTNTSFIDNSASMVDDFANSTATIGLESQPFPTNFHNSAINIIFDFTNPVYLEEFRIKFKEVTNGTTIKKIPKDVRLYGSNQNLVGSFVTPQTSTQTGDYQLGGLTGTHLTTVPVGNLFNSRVTASNLNNYLQEVQGNDPQLFRYYRLRLSGSFNYPSNKEVVIEDITPVTRSFTTSQFTFTGTNGFSGNIESASYAISSSHSLFAISALSASYASHSTSALSASYASHSTSALSASYASHSTSALSASYASHSTSALSASYASSSTTAFSASYASSSTSASHAITASFALTASYALNADGKDNDWHIGEKTFFIEDVGYVNRYLSSSKDVLITGSLKVSGGATIGNTGILAPKTNLTVDTSLLVYNTQSGANHKGIKLITTGSDGDNTSGRIIFNNGISTVKGFSINYNGGANNSILDLTSDTFHITNHSSNNTLTGVPSLVINDSNKIGILTTPNSFDLTIGATKTVEINNRLTVTGYQAINTTVPSSGDTRLVVGGNISASGHISASVINIGGGTFTSASLAAGGSGNSNGVTSIIAGDNITIQGGSPGTGAVVISASAGTQEPSFPHDALTNGAAFISASLIVSNSYGILSNSASNNNFISSNINPAHIFEGDFFNIFDKDPSTAVAFANANVPGLGGSTIDYDFYSDLGYSPIVNKFRIVFAESLNFTHHKQVQISGSNDAVNWTGIFEEPESNETDRTVSFSNNIPYKNYRITFKKFFFNTGQDFALAFKQIYYFGSADYNLNVLGNTNITGFISASGHISASVINIGGGTFTSQSLAAAQAGGDDLGNHTATRDLNMKHFNIISGSSISASKGVTANSFFFNKKLQPISGDIFDDFIAYKSGSRYHRIVVDNTDQIRVGNGKVSIGPDTNFASGHALTIEGNVSASGNLTVLGKITGNFISSSGHLFLSASETTETDYKILVQDPTTGQVFTTGSVGGGSSTVSGEDNDWEIEATRLTSSKDVLVKGGISTTNQGIISASGFLYGLLPPQTRPQPLVVQNTNKDTQSPITSGRLETSSLRVFNNIIASTEGTLVIGTNITDEGDTGGGNPPLPPNDPDGPVIFNPGGPVFFNNATTKHRGILDISGSGKLVTSGSFIIKDIDVNDNISQRSKFLTIDPITGKVFASRMFEEKPNTNPGEDDIFIRQNLHISAALSVTGSIDAHRAIIGISGSEKRAFNEGKLDDFFINALLDREKYSLYVRNGATIVGGDIIPDTPLKYSLGNDRFQFKDLHIEKGSIHFYSGSSETSGSVKPEIGRITINENTKVVEFKSGSTFTSLQADEIHVGSSNLDGTPSSSVQIHGKGQGFVAVMAQPGKNPTIFRAESPVLTGDLKMGSITQKGSGSFAILLDADQVRGDAKFVIESNSPIPGALGIRHFSVSESGETKVHGYLSVSQSITSSLNISASGIITANGGVFKNDILISGSVHLIGTASGHITASGNISASGIITAKGINLNDAVGNSVLRIPGTSPGIEFFGSTNDVERIYWDGNNIITSIADTDVLYAHSTGIRVDNNITASGNISASRGFFNENFNTLLASDTRPTLTIRNAGGSDISYLGSAVDNADAFIKFETDRSNTKFSVGIDSHNDSFNITEADTLNENNPGSTGYPTFKIKDNKVGIIQSTVSYPLDVGGDIRSTGTLRVDVIQPQTYGPFGTPAPFNSLTLSSSITASGHVQFAGNISGSHVTTASFGSLQLSNLPTSPTGLPTGSVWVSGSKRDTSTNNVNCGTLMIVI